MTRLALSGPQSGLSAGRVPAALGLVVALVAILDALVLLFGFDQDVAVPVAAALHLALVALGYWLVAKWIGEPQLGLLLGLWTCLLGPPGTLIAGLSLAWSRAPRSLPLIDEPWLQRLSAQVSNDDALVTALRDRRAYEARGAHVQSFARVMSGDDVRDKQVILGLIANSYEPAFHGLLMEALRSPQVAVRASAAAVLAKLRDRQADQLKRAASLAATADPDSMVEAARIMVAAAQSKLMTNADAQAALAEAAALSRRVSQTSVVPLAAARLARVDQSVPDQPRTVRRRIPPEQSLRPAGDPGQATAVERQS